MAFEPRKIETTLFDVLDLIACAEDYGHTNGVISCHFRDILNNTLPDEEIEWYIKQVVSQAEYTEEDEERLRERIHWFKDKYINNK